jgi:hypothetical protein
LQRAEGQSACTFYPVFKEPALTRLPDHSRISSSGEPSNITSASRPCQDFSKNSDGKIREENRRDRSGNQHQRQKKRRSRNPEHLVRLPAGSRSVQSLYAADSAVSTVRGRPKTTRDLSDKYRKNYPESSRATPRA